MLPSSFLFGKIAALKKEAKHTEACLGDLQVAHSGSISHPLIRLHLILPQLPRYVEICQVSEVVPSAATLPGSQKELATFHCPIIH